MAIKSKLAAAVVVGATFLASTLMAPAAYASGACGSYAPTTGWVNTSSVRVRGDEQDFTLRVDFVMSPDQLKALRCKGEYLEISAPLHGFSLPSQFDNYSITSDLPGYLHDLANSDGSDELSPGLTHVSTTSMEADRWYYFELKWRDDGKPGETPAAGLLFDPSHWAGTDGNALTAAKENGACSIGLISGNAAWCIFETEFHDWGSGEIGKRWLPFDPGVHRVVQF